MPTPPALPPRYRPLERVGVGGVGEVWRVEDGNLGRPLAVKILRPDRRADPAAAARLDREAVLTGALQHPGVPPVHERGELADGSRFFSMKLIGGETLRDLLKASGGRQPPERTDSESHPESAGRGETQGADAPRSPEDLARLLEVFRDVCQTLAYAHAGGVIHRDLKPANVMVGAFGEVQVMDWGMARRLDRPDPEAAADESTVLADVQALLRGEPGGPLSDTGSGGRGETLTAAGQVLGTVGYMAPEQARGDRAAVDERSDVFGLGAILCVLLTGEAPFVGSVVERFRSAHAGDLSDASARLDRCGADAELVALCRACLSPTAADRPADAGAVSARLGAYQDGVRERLRRAEIDRAAAEVRAVEEKKRRRVWAGAAALAVLLIAGVAGAGWWWAADRAERRQAAALAANTARLRAEAASADVRGLIDRAAALRDEYRFDAAATLLTAAATRLTDADDPDLTAAVNRAERDLAVVRELDRIRLATATWTNDGFDKAFAVGPDGAYAEAFRDYGIDVTADDPAAVGAAIAASPDAEALVNGLDAWATDEPNRDRKRRLLSVAQAAAPHPLRAAFMSYLADPDRAALAATAATADPASVPPALASTIGTGLGSDGTAFATAAAAAHPADFWVQFAAWWALVSLDTQNVTETDRLRAIGYLRAALAVRPKNAAVHVNLGNLLKSAGRVEEAEAAYREAIRLDPHHALAHINLGSLLKGAGRVEEAEAAYREAIRLDPRYAAAHNSLGILLQTAGRPEEAEAAFREAIRLDPRYAGAHSNLGLLLKTAGRVEEAEAAYREAIRVDPRLALAHRNLGNLLRDAGRVEEAEAAYREAIRIDPQYAKALCNLGRLLLRNTDRYAEAAELLRRGHELGSARPNWPYRSAEWVAEAEALAANADRLEAVLADETDAGSPAETAALADFALVRLDRPLAAARLFRRAFADLPAGERIGLYNAVRVALRCSTGTGEAEDLSAAERAAWRGRALDWLRADLERLGGPKPRPRGASALDALESELRHWRVDPDLAPVRGDALADLPEDERTAWTRLWDDHAALLRSVAGPVTAPEP